MLATITEDDLGWGDNILSLVKGYTGAQGTPPCYPPPASGQPQRVDYIRALAQWVTEQARTSTMYATHFELVFLFGEAGDLDYAFDREAPAPSVTEGWNRFAARIRHWARRNEDYTERLALIGQMSTRLAMDNGYPHEGVDS